MWYDQKLWKSSEIVFPAQWNWSSVQQIAKKKKRLIL